MNQTQFTAYKTALNAIHDLMEKCNETALDAIRDMLTEEQYESVRTHPAIDVLDI